MAGHLRSWQRIPTRWRAPSKPGRPAGCCRASGRGKRGRPPRDVAAGSLGAWLPSAPSSWPWLVNQAQLGWRRGEVASADLSRQANRLQVPTKESQNRGAPPRLRHRDAEHRSDRLYSRVTVLEQGMNSVTGAIAKRSAEPQETPAPDHPARSAQRRAGRLHAGAPKCQAAPRQPRRTRRRSRQRTL